MKFLARGEKVYAKFRASRRYPHVFKYFFLAVIFLLLSVIFLFDLLGFLSYTPGIPIRETFTALAFLSGIVFLITGELIRERIGTYYITNVRVIVAHGILATKTDSVSHDMIVNIKISQSLSEKVVGLGTVEVMTARGQHTITMIGVANPKKIENLIYKCMEARDRPEYGYGRRK